jgi:DNA-binding NarL/FixJ family response regulator
MSVARGLARARVVETTPSNPVASMSTNRKLAFIAAAPGPLMDGLKALLTTIPRIRKIESIGDVPTLLGLVAERRPSFVLLDFDLAPNEIAALLEQTRIQSPDTRYIILVDSVDEKRMAEMARTVTVLFKGSSPLELAAAVEMLLQPERRENVVD